MTYRLLRYSTASGPRAAILVDERVYDLAGRVEGADGNSVRSIVENWDTVAPQLEVIAANPGDESQPLDAVTLEAPFVPANIYCAGANYYNHYKEVHQGQERSKHAIAPYFFQKSTRAINAPGADVPHPSYSEALDWEAEIAAVIGRRARNVSAADALSHVAFYAIGNDMALRDCLYREDWPVVKTDWLASKSFEGSAPFGPWLTPAEVVGDPQNLSVQTWVSDRLEQDFSSKDMIYSVAEQIESLSARMALEPGDVIFTGTGAGVGEGDGKRRYMQPGDVCTITIEHLGTISNRIV